tara:strand:+ start:2680 stop:3462 length:783 start_codon:yes stop_codon:yes gene_type:complete
MDEELLVQEYLNRPVANPQLNQGNSIIWPPIAPGVQVQQQGNGGGGLTNFMPFNFGNTVSNFTNQLSQPRNLAANLAGYALDVPGLGWILNNLQQSFADRPVNTGIGSYSAADLNRMNALGGYYSEPMRQYRNLNKSRAKIDYLVNTKAGQEELKKMQAKGRYTNINQTLQRLNSQIARLEGRDPHDPNLGMGHKSGQVTKDTGQRKTGGEGGAGEFDTPQKSYSRESRHTSGSGGLHSGYKYSQGGIVSLRRVDKTTYK